MKIPYSGGCVCGALRYEVTAEPIAVAHCCCTDCQKTSGGAMSSNLLLPKAAVRITKGSPGIYVTPGDSGKGVVREFCSQCGSPIISRPNAMSDLTIVKVGTLDDPSWAKPQMAIYTDSAPPWVALPPDLPRFPKMPPM